MPSAHAIEADAAAGRPIVSSDESGFATDMPRTHGSAPKGKRSLAVRTGARRARATAIAAPLAGVVPTPFACTVTINSDVFHAWITHALIPTLPPGAALVMDMPPFISGVTQNRHPRVRDTSWNTSHPTAPTSIRANTNRPRQKPSGEKPRKTQEIFKK